MSRIYIISTCRMCLFCEDETGTIRYKLLRDNATKLFCTAKKAGGEKRKIPKEITYKDTIPKWCRLQKYEEEE